MEYWLEGVNVVKGKFILIFSSVTPHNSHIHLDYSRVEQELS
jgi:hypothetical protein